LQEYSANGNNIRFARGLFFVFSPKPEDAGMEPKHQLLLESLSHVVKEIDSVDHRIVYINKSIPGYAEQYILGTPIYAFVLPAFHDDYRNAIAAALKSGETQNIDVQSLSEKDKVNWFRNYISPVQHPDGSKTLLILSENIQAQKDAEKETLLRQQKMHAVINNTNDLIVSINRQFKVTEFNEAMAYGAKIMYGIDLREGMDVFDVIEEKNHGHQLSIYQRVFQGEKLADIELFDVQGHPAFFETHYQPVRNELGDVIGATIYSRNIDDRIRREQMLRKAIQDKDIMLSEIHHRLKNNLAIISSLLELQEQNTEDDELKRPLYESRLRIKSTALIHELLYENTTFEKLNLKAYLYRLFEMIRKSLGQHPVLFSIEGPDVEISSNEAVPVGLLFNELFTNAFKHGFRDCKQCELRVILNKKDRLHIDVIESEGKFPEDMDFGNPQSTGLIVVNSFIEQLQGEIRLNKRPRTHYEIILPV
jgi:PAS domain S-box-containing protein